MENGKKISEKVLKIKGIIETKEYKIKELQNFYQGESPKLLEIFTPSDQNHIILKEYINFLK